GIKAFFIIANITIEIKHIYISLLLMCFSFERRKNIHKNAKGIISEGCRKRRKIKEMKITEPSKTFSFLISYFHIKKPKKTISNITP
ncbi:MAG: hypothetical protein K2X86_01620, partial [Cytophagaceae bacterium]|nr:hypothetical protein [Cytophagaceae bacterium]